MPSTLKLFHRLTGTMDQPRSTGTHPESVLSPAPITLDSPPASPLIHPRRAAPIFLTHGGAKRPLKNCFLTVEQIDAMIAKARMSRQP